MKLESSPKLDSKTSQKSNKESESKQPKKIQRAKNTCDSKQSKKSKNSSKLKSFIRTIPISIALASALSSQAVAEWNNDGKACGNGYNCTISSDLQLSNAGGNIQIIASGSTGTLSINQGVHVQKVWADGILGSQNGVFEIKGATQGITNNGTVTSIGSWRNIVVLSGGSLGSIVNSSTGTLISKNNSVLLLFGRVGSIENAGTIMRTAGGSAGYHSLFAIEGQVGADLTFSNQSLTQSAVGARNIIWTQNTATSLGEIVAKDNSRLEGHFDFNNRFTGKSITFQDSANMTGNISLEGNARITNGVAIYDSGTIAGNISLAGSSAIANGITIGGNSASGSGNNATLTGNISLAGSSSISKILIDGSNSGGTNGTPKLDGDITMDGTSAIANGITITNGGTYAGRIHTKSQSDIDSITIASGGVVGSSNTNSTILSSGNSTIHNIDIQNGGTMYGNIEAHWIDGANAVNQKDGNIGNVSIAGRLQGDIVLQNKVFMNSLTMSDNGTITGNIRIGAIGSDDQFPTLGTITLSDDSGINAITLGGASAHATIDSLTLEGTSSIGTITNNSNGTITNIALNGTSTITNGITNNSGGNIGTIISNTDNGVNNTITNSGTIAKLDIRNVNSGSSGNGGTINYIGSGIVTEEIRVEGGATLSIDGGTGTITLDSDIGSKLNLLADSIFDGNLRNAGSISTWNNVSNIDGSFINASGASVEVLTAGSIANNLLNEGNITNLTINKNIGTLTNNGSGVINTLIIQNGSNIANGIINDASSTITTLTINDGANVTNGITNNSNIGSLNLQENVTYDGSGSITNALDIANNKTLTATNNGINILFANGATGTIDNEGIIDGSLTNTANSTIKSFNTGSISGSIANNATIQELNVTGNVTNGITNNSNIAKLNVNSNVSYSGDNGNISQELVINQGSGQITTFTIQGTNQTLTLGGTGNGGVKTITNEGTIIGNLINTLSTNWIGGILEGNFTNKSGATLESLFNGNAGTITGNLINAGSIVSLDSGTIGGSLDNQAGGIINTLHSSVVGNLSNAGVVKDFIVDSDMDYTGNGSITNSMTILNNNTLNIGNAPSNGTINIGFDTSATGTIGNAGTINGNITNLTTSTIKNFVNESTGKIDGDIINRGIITSFTNSGSFEGNLTNDKTIENLTTGAITGSIANSGNINTLNVTGNVTNGITNNASSTITTLTINNGASLGNNGIANEGNIGTLDINANTTYSGTGNITNEINVESGDTLTIGSGSDTLKFNAVNGTINNAGTIKGTIDNTQDSSILVFDNSGSITGIINNGHIVEFTNNASGIIDNFVNDNTISFFENKGVIENFSGNGIIYGVLNSKEIAGDFINVATSLQNTGTITGNVQLIGNQQNCKDDICQDLTSDLVNEGIITGTFTNTADKEMNAVQNTGVMGGISNEGIITTINTGSITGSIANSGEITTLKVTGNVDNGITNNSNITNLTISQGVSLGNNGITNNAAIGNFTNNANITYRGSGSITGNFSNTKDSTITLNNNNLILNGKDNTFSNNGILKGTISNIGALASFTNTGSITGLESGNITGLLSNRDTGIIDNLVVNGNVSQMQNDGNIADVVVQNEITNGIINGDSNHKQATIGKLDIQASLGSNGLQNAGTITSLINNFSNTKLNNDGNIGSLDIQKNLNYSGSGSITNSINIASNTTLTTNGITLNATNGSVNNEGILAGNLTLEGSSNSVTNSGSITAIINNADNSSLTNHSNIGALAVNGNLTYNGDGNDRITQALEVAKNKTLTIQNSGSSNGTLSFNSKNGNVNNLGTIEGNLLNVSKSTLDTFNNSGKFNGDITNDTDSTITNFANSGTITGDLYNDGHIDTLHNKGTMGTIYNRSKNTIKNLLNDKNSVIAEIDNSDGRYDLLQNQGTILGDIKNDNGTITNLVNTNNGTITGQIISNSSSNSENNYIGTIMNAGVINSSHTINDTGSIQDKTNDAIFLDTISNVVTTISNSGSINGNVRVAGNSEVNVIENSKVIAGCIILEGGRIGKIDNTNGATANCMSFSNGASVDNLNNSGTIKESITNDSGSMTVNNSGSIGGITTSGGGTTTAINSGSIGGITTSSGGTTTIINGGKDIMKGGHIGTITNDGSNSNTHIDGWTLDNPDNPSNPIIIADGSNTDGIHLKENSIFVSVKPEEGKIYNYYDYIQNEKGDSIGQEFSQDDELFDALTFIDILKPTDNGDGTYSLGLDTKELSGKTLGASLIYSSRMRQIDTNNMLREINVKNFKTDFEILEQRERLKNQQALLENYKQQRQSYLNGLTKDNKELKRVSSKESTSLSTYANNSNIKSDAIEVVDYYNEDTLASLDNLQATTKANQETYSNLDLLRELDDIFISHTGDKDNLYTFALPYTRYTSAQLDGGVGTLKSHASGILAGAQAKLPNERGILGIYFGYESSDKQVGQQRLDFDEKVYYGGLTYYNVFARKGVSEYYLSANTRIDKGDTNLYKTYRSGSTTIDSQVDSYGYGADLKVGANYYNIYNNSVISPEIGISYQGISTDSFRLRHLGGVSEHYYTQDVNFFDISASLRWQRAWNNVFKTMASLGAMYNVYNDAKGSGVIAGLKQSADINVEELYGTTQVGISYALGENANIALNYSGIFANGVQSHAGYIRLGVWW